MLYIKFDTNGDQIDASEDSAFLATVDLSEWDQVTGYNLIDLNFAEEKFKKDSNGTITLESIMGPLDEATENSNNYSFIDSQGRLLSEELYFEGGGTNSSNTSGWMRRFNGMTINNGTGMMFGKGAVIELIEFSCDDTNSSKKFNIYHYDSNGNNGALVYTGDIDQENNQFLYAENLNIYIPPRRRLACFITGNFRYPQYRLGYRRVFSDD